MEWENVNIFISSTFNDMHAERDYLVKNVFPRLSEWCEKRKLRLVDIDLRWGITETDAQAKNTIRACLKNIDECRPFFLCFLGQRRGWIPGKDDISQETLAEYPKLLNQPDCSVTEMEMLHALIDPMRSGLEACEHSFFYLRDGTYLQEIKFEGTRELYTNALAENPAEAESELSRWRDTVIPSTGRPVTGYTAIWDPDARTPEVALPLSISTLAPKGSAAYNLAALNFKKRWEHAGVPINECGEAEDQGKAIAYNDMLTAGRLYGFRCGDRPLADVIASQLQKAITERFGERAAQPGGPLQAELEQQSLFLHLAGEGVIDRAGIFDPLFGYINGKEQKPLFIAGPAGYGKTTLLAAFIGKMQAKNPDTVVAYRFAGASDGSTTAEKTVRSILSELKERGKIQSAIPAAPAAMFEQLDMFLQEASANGRLVLLTDALDQFENGVGSLDWVPRRLPENCRWILSMKRSAETESCYQAVKQDGGMILYDLAPFESVDDRKKLIERFLEKYCKALEGPAVNALVDAEGAKNPLFLKVAAAELRLFGSHEHLADAIRDFGDTPVSAFDTVLHRLESDPVYTNIAPEKSIPYIFSLIAHSKYGLTADEIAGLMQREGLSGKLQDCYDALYLALRQMRPYLAKRDGRVDFFYDSLRTAVVKRYAAEGPARSGAEWHRILAAYFMQKPVSDRHALMECAYQLAMCGDTEGYRNKLLDPEFLSLRLESFGIHDLLDDFAYARDDDTLKTLRDALRLARDFLAEDKSQLAPQLWGRLYETEDWALKNLLNGIRSRLAAHGIAWLRPRNLFLASPGGGMLWLFRQHAAAVLDGSTAVLTSYQKQSASLVNLYTGIKLRSLPFGWSSNIVPGQDGSRLLLGKKVAPDRYDLGVYRIDNGAYEAVSAAHTGEICGIVNKGGLVVTRSYDNTIKVWDLDTLSLLGSIQSRFVFGNEFYLFKDCARMFAACDDNTVSVFDPYTCAKTGVFAGFQNKPKYLSVSPDEKKAAVFEKGITVWDTETGKLLATMEPVLTPRLYPRCRAWSKSGRYFAYNVGPDMMIWDTGAYAGIKIHFDSLDGDNAVCIFSNNEKWVFTCGKDHVIRVWDAESGLMLGEMDGHASGVTALFAGEKDDVLISTSAYEHTTRVWNLAGLAGRKSAYAAGSCAVAFESKDHLLISTQDGMLQRYDIRAKQKIIEKALADKYQKKIILSGKGAALCVANFTVEAVDLSAMASTGTVTNIKLNELNARYENFIDVTPAENENRFFAALGDSGELVELDLKTGEITARICSHSGQINHVAYMSRRHAVIASTGGQQVYQYQKVENGVKPVMLPFDYTDATLKMWDLDSKKCICNFEGYKGLIINMALSPDETRLFTLSAVGNMIVWDTSTGRQTAVFRYDLRKSRYSAIAVSPNNRYLILCLGEELNIYDLRSGERIARFLNEFEISDAVFSGTGYVAAISRNRLCLLMVENYRFES